MYLFSRVVLAWSELRFGSRRRLTSLVGELSLGNFPWIDFAGVSLAWDRSLEIVRSWELSLGIYHLGFFLGIVHLGKFVWDPLFGSFAWHLSLGHYLMGYSAGGILRDNVRFRNFRLQAFALELSQRNCGSRSQGLRAPRGNQAGRGHQCLFYYSWH